MSTTTLFSLAEHADSEMGDVLGIIGERQLVAVQLFSVARHTSHPIAITPSSFVAVTGRGPRDSNESGKTSFNAAVSLLLGDPEWRVTGGGVATVAQLLFEPDTAGVTAVRYPAAQVGYIVGVFAHPDDVVGSAHTVWLRIASSPKYVRVRHQPGVHLVEADSDGERHRKATDVWRSLPTVEFGSGTYLEKLYGRSPRCLAYVASRGRQRSGPSLLKLDTGAFSPEGIGAALVRLTGRSEALELEKEQRRKLAEQSASVESAKLASDEKCAEEEKILDGVRTRETVRAKLGAGNLLWRAHIARGLLDTIARTDWLAAQRDGIDAGLEQERAQLRTLQSTEEELRNLRGLQERADAAKEAYQADDDRLQDAQRAETLLTGKITEFRTRMEKLEELGARDVMLTIAEAETDLMRSREARTRELLRKSVADKKVSALSVELELAERGNAGAAASTLAVLAEHGVEAIGLMDAIEVADGHREVWEPRLHPWRAAVCMVDGDHARRAVEVLADVPGAILVAGPPDVERPLPAGLTSAPNQALTFLTELASRMRPIEFGQVSGVLDPALGATVVAGFPRPTTGRTNIVMSLQDQLAQAEEAQTQAHTAADIAEQVERQAEGALIGARATTEYRELTRKLRAVETQELPTARVRVEEALGIRGSSFEALTNARADLKSAEAALGRVVAARKECEKRIAGYEVEKKRVVRTLDAISLDYWRIEFGADDTAARIELNWADGALEYDEATSACRPLGPREQSAPVERRAQDTLSMSANVYLTEILALLKVDRDTGEGAPTPLITEAVRRKEVLARSATSGRDVGYAGPATAIQTWLTQLQERDELATEQIASARTQRERELSYAMSTIAAMEEGLTNVQDSLERRIEANLDAISIALDRLNRSAPDGYGATLEHSVERPVGPEDPWIWSVVPMWRRSPGGRMLPYDNATNSAQEKLFSIHLVLAALLASPNPRGRVLILDELGDSLGEEHRRDVLSAVARVAEENRITVLGTCQDAVMPDAAAFCREILYFCYPSKSEALNLPTRMFGFDDNAERVELTAAALLAGRPRQ